MVSSTLRIDPNEASKVLAALNRHVMIVGASRGIGEALARRMAGIDGVRPTLASRSYNKLSGLKMELDNPLVQTTTCDLRDDDSIDDAIAATVDLNGPPTGLVITAGTHKPTPLDDLSRRGRERFDEVMRVNLTGPFFLAQKIADHMTRGGSIVFFGNSRAHSGMPGRHAHAAAKHGLEALVRGMARELGPQGIRVNMLLPDGIETPLGDSLLNERAHRSGQPIERIRKRMKATHALRRFVKADEVVDVMQFLLGYESVAITGQSIDVSCGVIR